MKSLFKACSLICELTLLNDRGTAESRHEKQRNAVRMVFVQQACNSPAILCPRIDRSGHIVFGLSVRPSVRLSCLAVCPFVCPQELLH